MKALLCWLLFLAVLFGAQLSQCRVILTHQRDLLWADENSVEISNVKKRQHQTSEQNVTSGAAEAASENKTLEGKVNETRMASEKTATAPIINKTEGLNFNTSSIDNKLIDTSYEVAERQTRSNGLNTPCRAQVLSYNPISFTSHELLKDCNPRAVDQKPLSYNDPNPAGPQNNVNSNNNHLTYPKVNNNPVDQNIQPHFYQNRENVYKNQHPVKQEGQPSPILCEGGYIYSDQEGACILSKLPSPVHVQTKYPAASNGLYQETGRNQMQSQFVHPLLKPNRYSLQQSPIRQSERNNKNGGNPYGYHAPNGHAKRNQQPYGLNARPVPTKEYSHNDPYFFTVDKSLHYKPQEMNRSPQYNGVESQYNQATQHLHQAGSRSYAQNEQKKANIYASESQGTHYVNENRPMPPGNSANREIFDQSNEKYESSNNQRASFNSPNGNYVNPPQENYASAKEINSPPSQAVRNDHRENNIPRNKYESDYKKASPENQFIPIKQYIAEKNREASANRDEYRDDSSEIVSSLQTSSYSSKPQYPSLSLSEGQSPSSYRSKYKQNKSYNDNPYVNLYTREDSDKSCSSRSGKKYSSIENKYPSNYEMTSDDASCKPPTILQEIILSNGGIILEGEYVLQRKSKDYGENGDADKYKKCHNYPPIIDRITIGNGGYIHKGKYTLDAASSESNEDSGYYDTGRTKKNIDSTEDEMYSEEVEVSTPYEIEGIKEEMTIPNPIEMEMFASKNLEEKSLEKRQLGTSRLPPLLLPLDLNLVKPILRGAAKVMGDVGKITMGIKQRELKRKVQEAARNIKYTNERNMEKIERFGSDLRNKLGSKTDLKATLRNRNDASSGTLPLTVNFNMNGMDSRLGGRRLLRAPKLALPDLSDNILGNKLFAGRSSVSEMDEIDPIFVRRKSIFPRESAYVYEEVEPIYLRQRPLQSLARPRYVEAGEPTRVNLLEPRQLHQDIRHRTRALASYPAESQPGAQDFPKSYVVLPESVSDASEYEAVPLARKRIHKVKSLVYDVPPVNYPSRLMRSSSAYESTRQSPMFSRPVFTKDGYWYENDLTDISKLQVPREIIYSDVIYATDSEEDI